MNKRYFSVIAIMITFIMLILATGCGVRINGKEYEFFSVSDEDKKKVLSEFKSEISANQEISEEILDADRLKISSGVGDIKIVKSSDSQISIQARKQVKGSSEKSKNNILENMNVEFERDGKVLQIVVKTKDGDDFWKWQNSNFKVYSTIIDFEISVPEGINMTEVELGVGDITVNDITSGFSIKTGVGEINIDDVAAKGDCALKTGTGDVKFEGNIEDISSFIGTTGVGDVTLRVDENSKMTIKATTGVGSLSGRFVKGTNDIKSKFEGDINGGGPMVELKTGVGDIRVDHK